ncbi:hypothetical protein F5Y17DRAFT_36176 [Xylariaceae sp. FL0594]|nr:hypothetical protein F5Y17DRAFT_36176 [Xylariaceae sp. FL0594]
MPDNAPKKWTEAEQIFFLVKSIEVMQEHGAKMPFANVSPLMPQRTEKSLRHVWENLRKEAAKYAQGNGVDTNTNTTGNGNGNGSGSGDTPEPATPASGKRKRAPKPTSSRKRTKTAVTADALDRADDLPPSPLSTRKRKTAGTKVAKNNADTIIQSGEHDNIAPGSASGEI